jgi:hypothetical protein
MYYSQHTQYFKPILTISGISQSPQHQISCESTQWEPQCYEQTNRGTDGWILFRLERELLRQFIAVSNNKICLGLHVLYLGLYVLCLGLHVLRLGLHVLCLGLHVLCLGLHALRLTFFPDFNKILIFLTDFHKSSEYQISVIFPVRTKIIHVDRWTDILA